MIVERIIFNVLAFALFFIIFSKMVSKNDTNYTYILIVQAVGILIGFVGLIFRIDLPIILIIITYLMSILLPLTIIIFERKGISLTEIINVNLAKYYYKRGDVKKAKEILSKAMEKYPDSYFIHKEMAVLLEENDNKDIAIDEYLRASEVNPEDKGLKMRVADLLKDSDRKEDATRLLNEMLKEHPDNIEATCLLRRYFI